MGLEQRVIVMIDALEDAEKKTSKKQSFARYMIKRAFAMFIITMLILLLILYMFGRACFTPYPEQKLALLRTDARFELFCSRLVFLKQYFE